MSPLPYLPSGTATAESERFILFANDVHDVMRIDESLLTKDGNDYVSYWESPSLGGVEAGINLNLTAVELYYAAAKVTTITVKASKDGGESWPESQTLLIDASTKRMSLGMVNFNITGIDIRIRIEFPTSIPVNIYGFRPTLVDRGTLII